MEKGQVVHIKIEDMSMDGKGIGKADGFAVFVNGAVLGDEVDAQLTKVKKNYGIGRLVEVTEPSPARQEGHCVYGDICGGCAYSRLQMEAQLALKEKQVKEKLTRLGGLTEPVVRSILGMEYPYFYRNKTTMAVSTGGIITKKGGVVVPVHEPRIGFFQAKSHDVVDCEGCLLQAPPAAAAAEALRRFMAEDNITSFDERWEKGLMRHLVVRCAPGTGQVMVILVANGKGIPNAEKLIDMLDEAIALLPVEEEGPFAGVEWSLESVVLNVNKKPNAPVLSDTCLTLAGKPTIEEELGGLRFEISPLSFYQVNPRQTEKLYAKALEYADLKGGETVLDLYCGVGTIGLFCADRLRQVAKETGTAARASHADGGLVIGIETVKNAVVDANRNAVINGIIGARYLCGKAEDILPKMVAAAGGEVSGTVASAAAGGVLDGTAADAAGDMTEKDEDFLALAQRACQADVAILDPPRVGCDKRLLETVAEIGPKRIVYVSCDPATLARDIGMLGDLGYQFIEATPVDMFPWTGSIETVALLTR